MKFLFNLGNGYTIMICNNCHNHIEICGFEIHKNKKINIGKYLGNFQVA